MKNIFYFVFALMSAFLGISQTGIGAFSAHDGGFENHTANLAGGNATNANLSTTLWTTNTATNIVKVLNATGGRSGLKYVTLGSANGTAKNFYTPQIAGAFAPNTTYQIQFWYKSASTVALDASTVDIYVDNTSATQAPPIGTKQSVAAGLAPNTAAWTKVAVAITTDATAAGNFGVAGFTIDAATAGFSADIDDFVVYQGATADTSAPNDPGAITAIGTLNGGADISWAASAGGLDGGAYVVVRYTGVAPTASDDPNQNGIYKFNNPVGAGAVRYIGTNTSFSDTSLSPGVDYYYKVYAVDKAFNYSNESTTTTAVQSLATTYYYKGTGSLADVVNWGLNMDGTGAAPINFTDASQVFEIRNTTAVTLDVAWTVGTSPANGTKVRLGNNSQAAITLTLNPAGAVLPAGTGNLDVIAPVSGNQTVVYKSTSAISFGIIFDNNLEIIYDQVTLSSSTTKSFGTVTLINAANITFTATPVIKHITVDQASTLTAPTAANAYITIPAGGSVVVNGTIKIPKLTGFVSSNATPNDAGGDLQFVGAENLTLGTNSIVEYTRVASGAQTVTARTDYKNLILSGTTPKTINGPTAVSGTFTVNQTAPATAVTLNGDVTVSGTLLFISGKITTTINNLVITSTGSISGAGTNTGWVLGNLIKQTNAGASPSFVYEIGDSNSYTPLTLTFSGNTTAAGALGVRTNIGDHVGIATSGIDGSKSVNKTWTLTNVNLAGFGSYNALFMYSSADVDSGSNFANYIVRQFDGTAWSAVTTTGVITDLQASATGLSAFGDFAIGEFDPLAVHSATKELFRVYPNPVSNGAMQIDNSDNLALTVELFDVLGNKVLSAANITDKLFIPTIGTGMYIARIVSEQGVFIQKIMVKND
ncbi:MAG: hypothetical protein CFE24_09765 [Flavobacterium sp. BFFFF2]|nr:MAG: hypothetical protein CFE24_09765 [Flavobacterium sp. BFFFF2]